MNGTGTTDQRPMGERGRRGASERAGSDTFPPPMTRREMRARGILLTTEVPVVEEPPDWPSASGAAAAASRTTAVRTDARRALSAVEETVTGGFRVLPAPVVDPPEAATREGAATAAATATATATEGDEAVAPEAAPREAGSPATPEDVEPESLASAAGSTAPPTPANRRGRRAARAAAAEVDAGPSSVETTGERTSTGRRPVVRAPLTARGMRTVDESGEITGVRPATGRPQPAPAGHAAPMAWASTEQPATVPQQTDAEPVPDWTSSPSSWESAVSMPAVVLGIEDSPGPPTDGPPITPPRTTRPIRRSLRPAGDEDRGLPGLRGRAKAPEASGGWAAIVAESADAAHVAEETAVPLRRVPEPPDAAPPIRRSRPEVADRSEASVRRGAAGGREARDQNPGALRIIILVAIGLAVGALIYLIVSGALGSLFSQGAGGGLPAGAVAVLAGWPSLTKELRDR